jgi:hypothetical protein
MGARAERAFADDDTTTLAQARTAREELRYDDALSLVRPLLDSSSPRRREAALEIAATTLLLEGSQTEGRAMLHSLYELAPAFALEDPSLPPRVTSAFAEEARAPHARAVSLTVRGDAKHPAEASIVASGDLARVALSCAPFQGRLGSEATTPPRTALAPVDVSRATPRSFHFRLPTVGRYQCAALGFDPEDLPLARLGSESAPVLVEPPVAPSPAQPASRSIASRWWFWTGIGALVAAGTVVAVFVAARPTSNVTATTPAADVIVQSHPNSVPSGVGFSFR